MKLKPGLIKGAVHTDDKGKLFYNNDFDLSSVKRIYFIKNINNSISRRWQAHKIEQRWFSAVRGSFKILLIRIDNWENPTKELKAQEFLISSKTLDVLHIPSGYASSIQALEESSKLLAMADYLLGDIKDEYRFEVDYFITNN